MSYQPQVHRAPPKVLLVSLVLPGEDITDAEFLLAELHQLVTTLDYSVVEAQAFPIRNKTASLLCGSGKADAIAKLAHALDCKAIVFDNPITPAQQRNWEKLTELDVLDRQEIILDIFAARAQTKEAVLQVELAQAEYYLPRLKRAWTHLSRQRGGSTMQRGDGETQIEVDQRLIRKRIASLKAQLKTVLAQRQTARKRRQKIPLPSAAIVGYTNAGKSSLLNALTHAGVLAEDKLFATLDPTTRKIQLPGGPQLLLTDTVGFVRRLPHRLVDAFKATLEEAVVANFIIHLVDASSQHVQDHIKTTQEVLGELGAASKPTLLVFNKIDQVMSQDRLAYLKTAYPEALFVSVSTEDGFPKLLDALTHQLNQNLAAQTFLLPYDRMDLLDLLHQTASPHQIKHLDSGVRVTATLPERLRSQFAPYLAK